MAHLTSSAFSPLPGPPRSSAPHSARDRWAGTLANAPFPTAGVSNPKTLSPGKPPRIVDSVSQTGDSGFTVSLPMTSIAAPILPTSRPLPLAATAQPLASSPPLLLASSPLRLLDSSLSPNERRTPSPRRHPFDRPGRNPHPLPRIHFRAHGDAPTHATASTAPAPCAGGAPKEAVS